MTSKYLTAVVEALDTVVTKVSNEERKLLMTNIDLSSSSTESDSFICKLYLDRVRFFHLQVVEVSDQIYLCRGDLLISV